MNYRIWIINILMAGAIFFVGDRIWDIWQMEAQMMPAVANKGHKSYTPYFESATASMLSEKNYDLIVNKNLFSPDRQEFVPESENFEPEIKAVRISGEKVELYGVVITEMLKTALINNPGGKLGDKKHQWIKEGQAIGNLKVLEIHPEEIQLDDGSMIYRILLNEKKRKAGNKHSPAPSAGPKVVTGGKFQKPKSASIDDSDSKANAAHGSSESNGAEYKIIETPFGKIKQRIK